MRKPPTAKLTVAQQQALRTQHRRLRQMELVMRRHPEADRADVWHTIIGLEDPWANLERSLLRGRGVEIHFR
ncbi:MAG: hypothetical protein NTY53_14680 [Kiritimatiellaeota bacterium]|nr:hypothetical protein [Kiritimatiellota bacterium]